MNLKNPTCEFLFAILILHFVPNVLFCVLEGYSPSSAARDFITARLMLS